MKSVAIHHQTPKTFSNQLSMTAETYPILKLVQVFWLPFPTPV